MEPQLIDFDQKKFNDETGVLSLFKDLFNGAIDIFNSLNVGKFRKEELKELILTPEEYIKIKMIEGKDFSLLTGLGLDQSKVIELLKLPEGLSALTERVEQITRIFLREKEKHSFLTGEKITELFHRFDFNEDVKLEIKQEYIDLYKKSSETYIQTEEAKDMFNCASEILASLKKHKIIIPTEYSKQPFLDTFFVFNGEDTTININKISEIERLANSKK